MKSVLRMLCGLLLLVLSHIAGDAQTDERAWHTITSDDGLAANFVDAIVQDAKGFIWFGSGDGLSRYDGVEFKNYHHDPSDTSSLSSGMVTALHACPSGLLWIGIQNGGVDIFDPVTERFTHLHHEPAFPWPKVTVQSIVEENPSKHWLGSFSDGLLEVDGAQTYTFSLHPAAGRHDTRSLSAMLKTRSGEIWVRGIDGVFKLNNNGASVPDLSFQDRYNSADPDSSLNMIEDRSGHILFVSRGKLFRFKPGNPEVQTFDLTNSRRRKEDSRYLLTMVADDERITLFYSGMKLVVAPNESTVFQRIPITRLESPLCAFRDSSGVTWLGSSGYGIERYDASVERFSQEPLMGRAYSVIAKIGFPPNFSAPGVTRTEKDLYGRYYFKDSRGNEWCPDINETGENKHVRMFYREAGSGTIYHPGLFWALGLRFFEDATGVIWSISNFRISKWDSESHSFVSFTIAGGRLTPDSVGEPNEPSSGIVSYLGSDHIFWFGSRVDGLLRYDPTNGVTTSYKSEPGNPNSLSDNGILFITADPAEPGRYLWIGTNGGGLNKFDKTSGRCVRITERDGLPNNVVYAVVPDAKGFLWITTNRGMCRLDPVTMAIQTFDINDGLPGMEFNHDEWLKTPEGRIYFGGTGGAISFNPEEIVPNSHIPPIVFTELRFRDNLTTVHDPSGYLKTSIEEADEIVVPPSENVITLKYVALDFRNPAKNRYAHFLEGFEKDWSAPSKERTVTYTNLNPGTYTLHVRASNGDNVWNMQGASLRIIILPPWYRTWWAYAGYAGFILFGLISFRRYDLNRIRLKDRYELAHARAEQLKEVDQLKMRFFQNISHEFRTPLTLILGPVEKLIGDEALEDNQKRDLRMVRRNGQRLLRLINQLLDLSKLEAGGMKLRASKANIVTFVRGMAMSFHSLAERKGIFLDVESSEPEIEAYFDGEKLEKIIFNLLSNALKFTPDNGEIIVTVRRMEEEHMWVSLGVRDTGIGIAAEKLPHIFDRFYQVDGSSTRSHEGTGIGLALTKDLVELHHGKITVTSEAGKGTIFTVKLPLGKAHLSGDEIVIADETKRKSDQHLESEMAADQALTDQESGPEEPENEAKPIVLVIEDNPDVREYVKSYLTQRYTIVEAPDGAAGVASAQQAIPDLVISDVMMPKMDGYEVCSKLKRDERTSHIPVILLTAKAGTEDRISGLETGADDYLVKPFSSAELLVRIKNLIDQRRVLRKKFGKELVRLAPGEVTVAPADEAFIAKLKGIMEEKLGDAGFGREELADCAGLTVRQLQRKLRGLADTAPNEFIRSFRLRRAMELLKKSEDTISEISYTVGFGSPAYFTKCFQEEFGITPTQARKQA